MKKSIIAVASILVMSNALAANCGNGKDVGNATCDTSVVTTPSTPVAGTSSVINTVTANPINTNTVTASPVNTNTVNANGGNSNASSAALSLNSNKNTLSSNVSNSNTNNNANFNANSNSSFNANKNVSSVGNVTGGSVGDISLNNSSKATGGAANNNSTNTNSANNSSSATGGNASTGAIANSNNSSAAGGAGGAGGVGGSSNVSIVNNESRAPVASAIAPTIVHSGGMDTCMGSTTGSVQGFSVGVAIGSTWNDSHCEALRASVRLNELGLRKTAMARLCAIPEIATAFKKSKEFDCSAE